MRKKKHRASGPSQGPHVAYGPHGPQPPYGPRPPGSYGPPAPYGPPTPYGPPAPYGPYGPPVSDAMYQQPMAPQPEAPRRKVLWHRVWGVGSLLLSLILLFLGVGSLLTLPDKLDDQRAYAAAGPCQGEAAASRERAADEPCLYSFTATVVETKKAGRGSSGRKYKLTVRTAEDERRVLGRFDHEPLTETLQPDQTLTVLTYRDQVVEFTQGTLTQPGTGLPDTKPVINTLLGTSMLTAAGWFFYLGLSAVASARGMARYGPRAVLPHIWGPFGITFLAPMVFAIPTRDIAGSDPLLVYLAAWFTIVVITLLGFRKRMKPHWDKA